MNSRLFSMQQIFLFVFAFVCLQSFLEPGLAAASPNDPRDGKLVRSEVWQPFDAQAAKGDFFVSVKGNDSWSGTLAEPNGAGNDGPFATVKRAQLAVRTLKSKVYIPKGKAIDARYVGTGYPYGKGKDIVVFIREGYYSLDEPLIFTPEDGGERVETNLPSGAFEWHHLRDNYVTYAAYPGEKPVISGAIPVKNWKKEGLVWNAPFSHDSVPALIANGKKQTLARTPNEGYFTLRNTPASTSEIPYKSGDIKNWKEMADNRIVILLRWRTAWNSISKIDEKKQIAYLRNPENGPDGSNNGLLVVPPRYYIENVKEFLDYPGEYYFDKAQSKISYIPAKGFEDPNLMTLAVPRITNLVKIAGNEGKPVRNLRFYGLIFEGAKENFRKYPHYYDPTPGCIAFTWDYASDCEFANSTLRACGGVGMTVGVGCVNTRIFGDTFDGLEQGAMGIYGTGDLQNGRLIQINRETTVSRNIFSECGWAGGITLGVGGTLHTTISRNYFTRSGRPYTIDCGGGGLEGNVNGDCIIEYNHFDDVQNDADDAGVIVVTGMTFNSVVRNNVIHKVHRGFFSDNVAFWFDNMSSNWSVNNNIYYDLEQGSMKTCGTYLVDNNYSGNFLIEPPLNAPEPIIEGEPVFSCSKIGVTLNGKPVSGIIPAGSLVKIRADVSNSGSSGTASIALYGNRKVIRQQTFPVIRNNHRSIEFEVRLNEPGRLELSVGDSGPFTVEVSGTKPSLQFDDLHLSEDRILEGDSILVTAAAINLQPKPVETKICFFMDGNVAGNQLVSLKANESKVVSFTLAPVRGDHAVRIENSDEATLKVLKSKELDLEKQKLCTYVSPKAKPALVTFDQQKNSYTVKASGWDFYHAEDAYATVYLKHLRGDFVATVRIASFGNRTSEWYRSGLFVRNEIGKSFDVDRGSKGSVLMFSTPGRAGIEYDEFGNGCMHKAASENLPENSPTPIWIRLERHGDKFSGYISLDGKKWIIKRQTNDIPGIEKAIDLGLAAGAPDQKQYQVNFDQWKVKVEDQ